MKKYFFFFAYIITLAVLFPVVRRLLGPKQTP